SRRKSWGTAARAPRTRRGAWSSISSWPGERLSGYVRGGRPPGLPPRETRTDDDARAPYDSSTGDARVNGRLSMRSLDKPKAKAGVVKVPFGKTKDGESVDLFVLTNSKGTVAKIMTYGATVTELWVADKDANLADVCLGFDDLKGYQGKGNPFFG